MLFHLILSDIKRVILKLKRAAMADTSHRYQIKAAINQPMLYLFTFNQTLSFFTCSLSNPKKRTSSTSKGSSLYTYSIPNNHDSQQLHILLLHHQLLLQISTMASTSGTKDVGPPRSLSRRMTRTSTMYDPNGDGVDSELVPSSLASIAPILRVANEIERDNERVAYLCMLFITTLLPCFSIN